jgi:hypothetical protein
MTRHVLDVYTLTRTCTQTAHIYIHQAELEGAQRLATEAGAKLSAVQQALEAASTDADAAKKVSLYMYVYMYMG